MNPLKKVAAVIVLTISVTLSAPAGDLSPAPKLRFPINGFYLDVQSGWAQAHDQIKTFEPISWHNVDFNQNNFTVGGLVGYNFNSYWAAELGYQYFNGGKITAAGHISNNVSGNHPGSMAYNQSVFYVNKRLPAHLVDLMARFNAPITNDLVAYVKGGGGFIHTGDVSFDTLKLRDAQNQIRPVAAAGLEYHATKNIGINAQYLRVFGGDKIASYDAVTGGLTYYFD